MTLHTMLKARRVAAGLTQAALAERVEVSRKTVNTVENGVFVPSTALALKLAAVLGCRVEDLFSLEPPPGGGDGPAADSGRSGWISTR